MSDLTGQEIKETYKDLLHMNNGNTGVTSDLSRVFDGEGTGSALHLSDTEASVMGNLGVGTTSPSAKLQIIDSNSSEFSPNAIISGSTTDVMRIGFDSGGARSNILSGRDSTTSGATESYLGFEIRKSTGALEEAMHIDSSGRVGIGGTTSPIFKLDVTDQRTLSLGANASGTRGDNTVKSSRVGGVRYDNASPVNMMMHVSDSTQNLLYFGWGTSHMVCPTKIVFGTAPSNNISSANSTGNQRMIIDGNGDVLIKNDLDVVGNLSKGSGTFKIDHPLPEKSETHHLVHSFIEGPKADNIYRGKVELVAGKAEVNIDAVSGMTEGTFVALNRDIQVFTSNENDWDAVRGKVEGNKLIIECQNTESTATISWLVIGERQDEHIRESKITDDNGKLIVEPLKPEPEPEYEEVEPEEVITEEPVAEEASVSIGASISGESLTEVSDSRAEEL
jgi:hypothetical protein